MALIGELQGGPMNNYKFIRLFVILAALILIVLIACGIDWPPLNRRF
jgi:hypothetical protein